MQCTTERLTTPDAQLSVGAGRYSIRSRVNHQEPQGMEKIPFRYEGSILSQLRDSALPPSLRRFRDFFLKTESLDMLTPERLRQRTRSADGTLGHGGRHLSAFIYELGPAQRKALASKLKDAYRQLNHVYAKPLRAGWKQLRISEIFDDRRVWIDAQHVNDGMLRLIAILAEIASPHQLLLFDEIENGINPELIEFVLDALVAAPQQIIVTTHSPMILNFLEDDVAKQGVIYLYRTRAGHTRATPFFSIPSIAEKLKFMGPGEAFADTDLTSLWKEIARVAKEPG